ncbi:MAG: hypothetical protein Greene041614_887 [Parcubacteria group bacterium Greene0416_14]|nr:MAG: hypothetical protein Greene041614_887 [Parcubacteria group bacterium Greene0416_14]TSD01100.1 MAG: hypothetical protein Greene101415_503 [Parcubacteria group bacterium Greene1014_15]TSD07970.1 MAG: hypothetical protein Greene07144_551 [Parcubacteria group bacterium Greene0714_4]
MILPQAYRSTLLLFERRDGGGFIMQPYNHNLKRFSRELRSNLTDAERFLWSRLRGKQLCGFQWYRQKPLASYIVDFYCPRARLVIEVDGGQHYDESSITRDKERDTKLCMLGLTVLRFTNTDILHCIDGVVMQIEKSLPTSLS